MFWQNFLQLASNLVAGCPQIIGRKAVNCPQYPRILRLMPTEMTVHTSWQYKDIFLSVNSSQFDSNWHALVRDGHRSTTNLLPLSGLYTIKLWPLRASCWCFAQASAGKYPQLTRTKFWAWSQLVCGQIGLACTLAGKSGLDPCGIRTGACFLCGTAGSKNCSP